MSQSKYGNKRTQVDGYTFDSLAEARRYGELRLMEKAGEIRDLQVHPVFDLTCPTESGVRGRVAAYEADFVYIDNRINCQVVEDVKGVRTAMYRLKKKWLKLEYGIEIVEIEA